VFDFSQDAKRVKKLRHLRINLVGIGAAGGEPMNGTAAALSGQTSSLSGSLPMAMSVSNNCSLAAYKKN